MRVAPTPLSIAPMPLFMMGQRWRSVRGCRRFYWPAAIKTDEAAEQVANMFYEEEEE